MSDEHTTIVRVGAGSFATVFVWQSHNHVVFKKVQSPSRGMHRQLSKEYDDLQLLHSVIHRDSFNLFHVPRPIKFYSSLAYFKACVGNLPLEEPLDDTALYAMERIWPVPPRLAGSIRQHFFPVGHKDNEQAFVSRIQLGQEVGAHSEPFTPQNFPLDSARLATLDIGVATSQIAGKMGLCLAHIHYKARRDARGVKFVVGSQDLDTLAFFCIDFDRMQPWNSPADLIVNFFAVDLCYPQPGTEHWEAFDVGYRFGAMHLGELRAATEVLDIVTTTMSASRAAREEAEALK